MKDRQFTWPYPKSTNELIQVIMVAAAAILIVLLFLAYLSHSYQTRVITQQHIKDAASSLSSTASQADVLVRYSLSHKTTQNYQETLAHNLHEETTDTLEFLESHEADRQSEIDKSLLIRQARHLQAILHDISSLPDKAALYADRAGLHDIVVQMERLQ